jgi:hypothetical protein
MTMERIAVAVRDTGNRLCGRGTSKMKPQREQDQPEKESDVLEEMDDRFGVVVLHRIVVIITLRRQSMYTF